jgi:hypothetical protein
MDACDIYSDSFFAILSSANCSQYRPYEIILKVLSFFVLFTDKQIMKVETRCDAEL